MASIIGMRLWRVRNDFMDEIMISIIKDEHEIEILHDKKSFNYTYDNATIDLLKKNFSLHDSLYLIARQEEKFVGFCSIDRDWWENNYFFIREIFVDLNFQKSGIGSELMSRCIEYAKDKKAFGVVTETAFENFPMQKLCEKLGFTKWDNPQWKDGITYRLIF